MSSTVPSQALVHLLDRNRNEFECDYRGYFSNHLPQALVALNKLGASDAQLTRFYENYAKKLLKSHGHQITIDATNWKTYLGKEEYFRDYIDYFKAEIATKGLQNVLVEYLPILACSLHCHAFHPFLTLGFGLDAQESTTVAEGLAYMCYAFEDCRSPLAAEKDCVDPLVKSPAHVFEDIRQDHTFDRNAYKPSENFTYRFNKTEHAYGKELAKYDINLQPAFQKVGIDGIVDLFSLTAVQLYAYTGAKDFFLLHGVTSFHALRHVIRALGNRNDVQLLLLRHFWRSVVVAYIVQQRPQLVEVDTSQIKECPWSELAAKVLDIEDEHVIKMVYVNWEEFRKLRNKVYWYAAKETYERIVVRKEGYIFREEDGDE